ncbi:MAG: ATP-binding cassette domain-containing protein, partial [Deltaproteobacteria bacterium]|nr:ATP-binding cassette domain-containing protein [Deltaproteobacteria bacterium]
MAESAPLIEVEDLKVVFMSRMGELEAVRGISFRVERGQVFGLAGESGSGKSVAMLAVMGLLPPNAVVTGSVRFNGVELLGLSSRELSSIRGAQLAMVFQDPL